MAFYVTSRLPNIEQFKVSSQQGNYGRVFIDMQYHIISIKKFKKKTLPGDQICPEGTRKGPEASTEVTLGVLGVQDVRGGEGAAGGHPQGPRQQGPLPRILQVSTSCPPISPDNKGRTRTKQE